MATVEELQAALKTQIANQHGIPAKFHILVEGETPEQLHQSAKAIAARQETEGYHDEKGVFHKGAEQQAQEKPLTAFHRHAMKQNYRIPGRNK